MELLRRAAPDPRVEAVDREQQPDREDDDRRAAAPLWTGRITTVCSATPPANESAIVAPNAGQNAQPWSISVQQTNAESVAISPCAKLITPVDAVDRARSRARAARRCRRGEAARRSAATKFAISTRGSDRRTDSFASQVGGRAAEHDAARLEHVRVLAASSASAAFCSTTRIVVPRLVHLRERLEDLAHDERREPERRLVEEQQARLRHQRARRARASAARRPRASRPAGRAARRDAGRTRRRARGRARDAPRCVQAPRRRLSSTVSVANVPRPSGTCAMPRRAIASGVRRKSSARRSRTSPLVLTVPEIARSVVVLPAPFAPRIATKSPSSTRQRDAVQRLDLAVARLDVAQLKQRQAAPAAASSCASSSPARAQVAARRRRSARSSCSSDARIASGAACAAGSARRARSRSSGASSTHARGAARALLRGERVVARRSPRSETPASRRSSAATRPGPVLARPRSGRRRRRRRVGDRAQRARRSWSRYALEERRGTTRPSSRPRRRAAMCASMSSLKSGSSSRRAARRARPRRRRRAAGRSASSSGQRRSTIRSTPWLGERAPAGVGEPADVVRAHERRRTASRRRPRSGGRRGRARSGTRPTRARGHAAAARRRGTPRSPPGSRCTSSGVPSAILRPKSSTWMRSAIAHHEAHVVLDEQHGQVEVVAQLA